MSNGFDWITTAETHQLWLLGLVATHLLRSLVRAEMSRPWKLQAIEMRRQRDKAYDALHDARHEAIGRLSDPFARPAIKEWSAPEPRRLSLPKSSWPGTNAGRLPIAYGPLAVAELAPFSSPPRPWTVGALGAGVG